MTFDYTDYKIRARDMIAKETQRYPRYSNLENATNLIAVLLEQIAALGKRIDELKQGESHWSNMHDESQARAEQLQTELDDLRVSTANVIEMISVDTSANIGFGPNKRLSTKTQLAIRDLYLSVKPFTARAIKNCPFCDAAMDSDDSGFTHPQNADCVLGSASWTYDYLESWNARGK